MDADRFDHLAIALVVADTRRSLLRFLAALPLGSASAARLEEERAVAKRRHRGTPQQRRGSVHEEKKKKKRKKKKKKKVSPVTPACVPNSCPPNACGSLPDGCGGTLSCGCAGTSLCHAGVCQPCTVTCDAPDHTCDGTDLQAVLDDAGAGDTVYVCPGRYRGHFNIDTALRVIGAGEGPTSTNNTILDANGAGRVLHVTSGTVLVELERLRITGGDTTAPPEPAGGVLHEGMALHMTECTVSGNKVGAWGGGIWFASDSTRELTRCTVRDNEAGSTGGGIDVAGGTVTLTDCLIEENRAGGSGGGLQLSGGTTTLAGTTQVRGNEAPQGAGIQVGFQAGIASALVIAETCQVTENRAGGAGNGGGIFQTQLGTATLQGVHPSPIVVNNCFENCVGNVPGCSTDSPTISCS